MNPSEEICDVLVVDDEPIVREAVRRILVRDGYRASTADCARSALASPLLDSCRMLVCDLLLPDVSGIELVAQIRSRRPSLPIVMITGCATPEVVLRARATGAELLPKPFDDAELLDAVHRALEAAPAHSEERLP
jgi:DNA-binding NtrC family response regulator